MYKLFINFIIGIPPTERIDFLSKIYYGNIRFFDSMYKSQQFYFDKKLL